MGAGEPFDTQGWAAPRSRARIPTGYLALQRWAYRLETSRGEIRGGNTTGFGGMDGEGRDGGDFEGSGLGFTKHG